MSRRRFGARAAAWLLAAAAACAGLAGCDKAGSGTSGRNSAAASPPAALSVLAGSELKEVAPILQDAARQAGIDLKLSYAGTLDIVERVNAGEPFDAILPPNGAYPELALAAKPLAREKLFYSRVALGVKDAKLRELGWDRKPPTWADIAKAASAGKLRFAMTNPVSSNTGMSALFAVASAVAGKAEDLQVRDVNAKVLSGFLSGQKLTAGSSGWLADAYARQPGDLDAMVNYEAVILRANQTLAPEQRLTLVYPQDGVITADYPLLLLQEARREPYTRLIAALKKDAVQAKLASEGYLRPSVAGVAPAAGLPQAPVAELSFPNSLDTIDAVLSAYQGEWRRPATSIFVLDVSGSMSGGRMQAMQEALKLLTGADARTASSRYASFQGRERVILLPFSDQPGTAVQVDFDGQRLQEARRKVQAFSDGLQVIGGTAIYAALIEAERMAAKEQAKDARRYVSIVLLTDGENNSHIRFDDLRSAYPDGTPARIFPILFGEASTREMEQLAQFTGGRVFDGRKASLPLVFKEIRGYQ